MTNAKKEDRFIERELDALEDDRDERLCLIDQDVPISLIDVHGIIEDQDVALEMGIEMAQTILRDLLW